VSTRPNASVFVARQPILDPDGRVFGYELLYRASAEATECAADADLASARVFTDGLLAFGLDTLTHGQRAFFNVSRRLLLEGAVELLPNQQVVIEIPGTMTSDGDVLDAGRRLRQEGYTLALDGDLDGADLDAWLPLVDFVKVDVLATTREQRASLLGRCAGATMVAKKVETHEAYRRAHDAGFRRFQGFYFSRPVTLAAREIPGRRLGYLRLLQALVNPALTVNELESLVKHDVSLCYRVLRTVNSAAFGLQLEVRSVRQALVLLGRDAIRKWVGVWAIAGLAEGRSRELVTMALIRGECCATLGRTLWDTEAADELFLVGVLSLLDAILERPMMDVVSTLPLSAEAEAALRGEANRWRQVLDCVVAYERAEWAACEGLAARLGIAAGDLPDVYAGALRWARELTR
jgi:c-di-GMP-related signal transduction protein